MIQIIQKLTTEDTGYKQVQIVQTTFNISFILLNLIFKIQNLE